MSVDRFKFDSSGTFALDYILDMQRFEEIFMTEHAKPQKLPDNWGADGLSKGKQTGPVRPTPDAHAPKK